ncbi:MAG: hypothetical protein ABIR83_03265 [Nakamurella sp.]
MLDVLVGIAVLGAGGLLAADRFLPARTRSGTPRPANHRATTDRGKVAGRAD